MRVLVLLALSFVLAAPRAVSAQGAVGVEARVTWYGVYRATSDKVVEDKSSFSGTRLVSTGVEPPKTNADRIPAILHTRFGFGFLLSGRPAGAVVALRYVRVFPPPGVLDPKSGKRQSEAVSEIALGIGQNDAFLGYSLDEPYELVPGEWRLELWEGERKLAGKRFNLYTP